jgi:hypothetical protein
MTQEALIEWFAQSERLNIARTHYHLRGDRFCDFARRIGVDRSSAFQLVKLHQHRATIMSRCLDQQGRATARGESYSFPGWETALGWFGQRGHRHPPLVIWQRGSDEWEAPHALFTFLDRLFHFDHDVCASPQTAKCSAMVVQLQGRLRFIHQGRIVAPGSMSEAPFPSILAIWPREAGVRLMPHCTPVSAVLLQLPE